MWRTMSEVSDLGLLRCYAEKREQAAFAELVRRRVNLVYSVALRQCGGDSHLAEDVTQKVFTDLARKAGALSRRAVLSGWLYRSAQFAASDIVRAERRRRARETDAQMMQATIGDSNGAIDWEKIRPVIDDAMAELPDADRDAVALRFFEERSYADIAGVLRLSEEAARKRVDRAIEKLHGFLARRGVNSTSAALAIALANQATVAAPAGLAASVAGIAVAAPAAAGWGALFMGMSKIQVGIVGAVGASCAATFIVQGKTNVALRREIAALAPPPPVVAALRAENRQLANAIAEVEMLRRDDLELKQVELRVAELKTANEERKRQAQLRTQDARQQFYDKVRADEALAQQEVERMNREGQMLTDEYKDLVAKSKDTSLAPEARTQAEEAAKNALEVIKQKQQAITSFMENVRRLLAQRVAVFQQTHGDDSSMPPPTPQSGAGQLQLQSGPIDNGKPGSPPRSAGDLKFVPKP
jgi:RNA polymerase sigma factor (sigma-70 family)